MLVDGGALCNLLTASGLVDPALAAQVGRLAGDFPANVQRDLFLEFELADRPIPAGFGLGFPAGDLDRFRAVGHAFLSSHRGRALRAALADDPFAEDHRKYMNLFGDSDPDWVEYDISGNHLAEIPFVFFRLPSRLRQISLPAQVLELCAELPGGAGADFAALVRRAVELGTTAPYRIGVARSRGLGWWRAIITKLEFAQVLAALEGLGSVIDVRPLAAAARFYERGMDQPGACFALSIDVQDGRVTAVDVECPYLFRVADPAARAGPLSAYAREIATAGLVSAQTADWITDQAACEVTQPFGGPRLRSLLHHLKFRLVGEPRPRIKAYLHLELAVQAHGGDA